jgi:hypothetical protein
MRFFFAAHADDHPDERKDDLHDSLAEMKNPPPGFPGRRIVAG